MLLIFKINERQEKGIYVVRDFYFVPDTGKRAQATWWLFSWLLSIKKQDTFPIKKKMLKKMLKMLWSPW